MLWCCPLHCMQKHVLHDGRTLCIWNSHPHLVIYNTFSRSEWSQTLQRIMHRNWSRFSVHNQSCSSRRCIVELSKIFAIWNGLDLRQSDAELTLLLLRAEHLELESCLSFFLATVLCHCTLMQNNFEIGAEMKPGSVLNLPQNKHFPEFYTLLFQQNHA